MNAKILAVAAAAACAAVAAADTVDVDISGFQVFGNFSNPSNSYALVNIGAGSVVTAVEYIDVSFESYSPSWMSEVTLSVENSDASSYWDYTPATGMDSSGIFGPASGFFGGVNEVFVNGDGLLRVYAWDSYADGVNPDAMILTGTIRITYTAVPAPGALALLGLAGVCGARRRRA